MTSQSYSQRKAPSKPAKRIFLSYAFDDQDQLATRLGADLARLGYDVQWFERQDLPVGHDWERLIEEALDHAADGDEYGFLVLLMTPRSVRRPDGYCLNELVAGQIRRLAVIPLMVVWCDPPLSICRVQWLDMRNCLPVSEHEEEYERRLAQLLRALEHGGIEPTEEFATLRSHLNPLDFSADLAGHARRFVGREWLRADLKAWLDRPDESRIFWLTGEAGVGKTSFAAYVCNTVEGVGAFHLCRHGHDDKADPHRCVLSLAYQLSSQLPEYRRYLTRLNLVDVVKKSAATIFDTLIVQPLATIDRPEKPVLVVIDALDEARGGADHNDLARFLSKGFPHTPTWLRLLVTSRRYVAELDRLFRHIEPRVIDPTSTGNLSDLRSYLERGVREIEGHPTEPVVIEKILEKSEGFFLYAEWVLRELRGGRRSLDRVDGFPQGLGQAYFDFFERQFPDGAEYSRRYRPLFELLVASPGPLPLLVAKSALAWGSYDLQVGVDGAASGTVIDQIASLFPCEDGVIRPFHHSLRDWLTEPLDSGEYYADEGDGRERLTNACWAEFQQDPAGMSPYVVRYLPTLLMSTQRWDDLLALVMSPAPGLLQRWTQGTGGEAGAAVLEGLIGHFGQRGPGRRVVVAGLATQLARIHSRRGEYEVSEYWLSRALAGTRIWRGRRVRAVALHELASLALYRYDSKAARRGYRRAYRLCVLGLPIHHDEAAANLSGLATVAYAERRYAECLRTARHGIREARRAGDARHRVALARISGSALRALGKLDQAEEQLQGALVLADRYGEPVEAARLLLVLGFLWFDRAVLFEEPPHVAEDYLTRAATRARDAEDFYCSFEGQLGLAMCEVTRGALRDAENRLKPLETLVPEESHPEIAAGLALGLARLTHKRGDLEAARDRYGEVVEYCRTHDVNYGLRSALVGLGATYWHTSQVDLAEVTWAEAIAVAARDSDFKRRLTEANVRSCRADAVAAP